MSANASSSRLRIRVSTARHWWQRARGLIARPAPAPGAGMFFPRTSAVHGMGMTHALDLVFLDCYQQVLRVARLPVMGMRSCRHASAVLELREGEAARLGIRTGMRLQLDECGDIFQ